MILKPKAQSHDSLSPRRSSGSFRAGLVDGNSVSLSRAAQSMLRAAVLGVEDALKFPC
jgi:hypothetical protein